MYIVGPTITKHWKELQNLWYILYRSTLLERQKVCDAEKVNNNDFTTIDIFGEVPQCDGEGFNPQNQHE